MKTSHNFLLFYRTDLLLKASEMYSSDKERTKKKKSHVTETEENRSYTENAEVGLKSHGFNRQNTAGPNEQQHCREDKLLEAHR